jgi:thiamine biosynthesis protein ThiS
MEMTPNARITLNGKPHEVELPVSVEGLLASLGMAGKPVVVELDELVVFPRNFSITPVAGGARVEIVVLAAGG